MRDGGIRCACPSIDKYCCVEIRYPRLALSDDDPLFEPCECPCHDDYEDGEDCDA